MEKTPKVTLFSTVKDAVANYRQQLHNEGKKSFVETVINAKKSFVETVVNAKTPSLKEIGDSAVAGFKAVKNIPGTIKEFKEAAQAINKFRKTGDLTPFVKVTSNDTEPTQ